MPHTDAGLPFAGGSIPLTRHTSRQGAEDAEKRAPAQLVRMMAAYVDAVDGYTDAEMAAYLGIPLASVCARRSPLRKAGLIYAEGVRPGPTGVGNSIWRWRRT